MPKKYTLAWDLRERTKFCIDCKWGDFELARSGDQGLCRKNPPHPFFHLIRKMDWCGSFEQAEKAKKEAEEIALENPLKEV